MSSTTAVFGDLASHGLEVLLPLIIDDRQVTDHIGPNMPIGSPMRRTKSKTHPCHAGLSTVSRIDSRTDFGERWVTAKLVLIYSVA
jgi:hypothetical protein